MNCPITKTFTVERSSGFKQEFVLRTYDSIFNTKLNNDYAVINHLFYVFTIDIPTKEGRTTCSNIKASVPAIKTTGQLTALVRASNYEGHGQDQHTIVQKYLLANDMYTIACEVPVWDDTYHGFIDIVRHFPDEDIVQIIDFKPNAKKEKYAAGQVLAYMQLFHKMTGHPMERIEGLYLDNKDCYMVQPPLSPSITTL